MRELNQNVSKLRKDSKNRRNISTTIDKEPRQTPNIVEKEIKEKRLPMN